MYEWQKLCFKFSPQRHREMKIEKNKFRDWENLATKLADKHNQFKRMAILTGSQFEAMNNIGHLLIEFAAGERSVLLHAEMKAAAKADMKMIVIKTR